MRVILVGPPGAGKGTQARSLALFLHVPYIASGDLFRTILQQATPLAQEVRANVEQGLLVSDSITIRMMLDRLNNEDAARGFLLDGFPRSVPQAEALDAEMERRGTQLDLILHLKAAREIVLRRLTGRLICPHCNRVYNLETRPPRVAGVCDRCGNVLQQRSDEMPETQRRRLDVYDMQTSPILAYYRTQGKLRDINAEQDVEKVRLELQATVAAARSIHPEQHKDIPCAIVHETQAISSSPSETAEG